MQNRTMTALVSVPVLAIGAIATAEIVTVSIEGTVEFNQINGGALGGVMAGDAVVYSFQVDSDNFVNGSFPTRGYEIISDSFSATFGGAAVGLANPYPGPGAPYFVLRNDDPAVDGFFLGENPDGFPNGVATDEPGIFGPFNTQFSVAYDNDPLDSLDILGAVGVYEYDGLTSFNMVVGDGSFDAMFIDFERLTIVPAPGVAFLFGGLVLARRRRG